VDPADSGATGRDDSRPDSAPPPTQGKRRTGGWSDLGDVLIERYELLGPNEMKICSTRKHWAILTRFTVVTLASLLVAGLLSAYLSQGAAENSTIFSITLFHHVVKEPKQNTGEALILSIWLGWVLVLMYVFFKIYTWFASCLIVTSERIILAVTLLSVRFATLRIEKLTSWYLRSSVAGRMLGYTSLVVVLDGDDPMVRTITHIPFTALDRVAQALDSVPREEGDTEAFEYWTNKGGPRRSVRLGIAVILICLTVALALTAATVPSIRAELGNETEIIALLPIVIAFITPKT
jgi:uncharacterized membrane protein YdbT with pleckstrin-like domain